MHDLTYRQQKIQEKRKQTPWREFVREIASRRPLVFYKNQGLVSRYPETGRVGSLVPCKQIESVSQTAGVYTGDFFNDFQRMWQMTTTPATRQVMVCENADYADMVHSGKNIYLSVISVYGCENILYSFSTRENSKDIVNSMMVFDNSSYIYQSAGVIGSYAIFYSKFVTNSNNLWFCVNCVSCTECIGCSGLTNQSYCIQNKQYTKEEYMRVKAQLLHQKEKFSVWWQALSSQGACLGSETTTGSFVVNSQDVENGYFSYNAKNCRNVCFIGGANGNEQMYDVFVGGAIMGNHIYGTQGGGNSEHIYCSAIINDSSFLYYCIGCSSCSFCVGCTRLRNASYCIFNKQYTKEERYEKVDEIFGAMDQAGTLGQFFPGSVNPFYFNDTAAYLIDSSFTKEEVTKLGYLWRDEQIHVDIPEFMETVKTTELGQYEGRRPHPDPLPEGEGGQRRIDPTILKKVIIDEQGNSYRVIKMEYDFLMKYGLPLPRKHWTERMKENFKIQ